MSSPKLKTAFLLLLTLLYNYFFWNEKTGLNLLIFYLLLAGTALYFNPYSLLRRPVLVSLLFTLITAVMVVWHNSFVSKFAHFGSFFILVGFLHEGGLRSVTYALFYAAKTTALTLPNGLQLLGTGLTSLSPSPKFTRLAPRWLKLLTVPGAFFSVFFLIFSVANPIFADLSGQLGTFIGNALEAIFTNFSLVRMLFVLMGLFLIAVVLYKWEIREVAEKEAGETDQITRRRLSRKLKQWTGMIALKNERQAAMLLTVSVNILLLVVNVIDIRFLWFNFDAKQAGNLAKLVHEGTYMLILSILLSIGILIYYFRNNLNFYPGNGLMKGAAYVWLVQNAVLAISVLMRCYYYIEEYGLAYKRIGVIVFLLLTFFGLFTLYRKIETRKSLYYLIRTNTWAAYTVMMLLTLVNWDVCIVEYNLSHPNLRTGHIDVSFLLSRSDKTLHLLDANRNKIMEQVQKQTANSNADAVTYAKLQLNSRIKSFLREQRNYSWLSWNYADARTLEYFQSRKHPVATR